jgi:hypothetical protein
MSITNYTTSFANGGLGGTTTVTVTSDLTGVIYYFWYLDGSYLGVTSSPSYTFILPPGVQATVTCIDANSSALPSPPAGWPSTRTLEFVRSLDATIARYSIQQSESGGAWVEIRSIQDDPTRWGYQVETGPLDDLTDYAWQVVPHDVAGNAGTPVALGNEFIVRTPDAPEFTIGLNGSQEVVFAS